MKYFSAQYIFTNTSAPIKRGVICTEDDGTIVSILDNGGDLKENHSVEFYNGIIVPGFVNCHCHIELSYLKNEIPAEKGLADFLRNISNLRNTIQKDILGAIKKADEEMFREGIVLCADICNSEASFEIKKESRIKYISLLEVFGIDSGKAYARIEEIKRVAGLAAEKGIPFSIVPHSAYSVSLPLLKMIKDLSSESKISSIHFLESADEAVLLSDHSGPLMDSYRNFLPPFSKLDLPDNHIQAINELITSSGNLLLVHNTFAAKDHINGLKNRKDLYWCLCPNSNLRIERKVPPVNLLVEEECNIVIGTDSLSSNSSLSIIDELKTIQNFFPSADLTGLIAWATINGAKALKADDQFGSIEAGKKPGLVLIRNADLINLKLLPETSVRRLI